MTENALQKPFHIQLFCQHEADPPICTHLEKVLENPGLIEPNEWIDLDNKQVMDPYGAIEFCFHDGGPSWFFDSTEDLSFYGSFLTDSLFAVETQFVPVDLYNLNQNEVFMGVQNVVAKIFEYPRKYVVLGKLGEFFKLVLVDEISGDRQEKMITISQWRLAVIEALKVYALFYKRIVIPAFLESPLKDEIDFGVNLMSKRLEWLLGNEYSFFD